jgi:hypothetical protein
MDLEIKNGMYIATLQGKNVRVLKLAVVKLTTVQVTKLPL